MEIIKKLTNFSRTRKLPEIYLSGKNFLKGINNWAVGTLGPFFKWAKGIVKQIDQRTSKLLWMFKALHSRNDIDILYVLGREGETGLVDFIEDMEAAMCILEDYIKRTNKQLP